MEFEDWGKGQVFPKHVKEETSVKYEVRVVGSAGILWLKARKS